MPKGRQTGPALKLVLATLVIGASAFGFLSCWPGLKELRAYRGSRFDRAIWLAYPDAPPDDQIRAHMVDDLTSRVLKRGMSKAQVMAILGKPGYDGEREVDGLPGTEFTYSIGTNSDPYDDLGYLVLLFDAVGRYEQGFVYRS